MALLVALGCSDPATPKAEADVAADTEADTGPGAGDDDAGAVDAASVDAGCLSYTDCPELALPACQIVACEDGECVATAAPDGLTCDDGTECTLGESCKGGQCTGGTSKPCEDGNPCTDDVCDADKPTGAKKGACAFLPSGTKACDDGDICTVGDACAGGACKPGKNNCECAKDDDCQSFEDGNACNGTLVCTKTAGIGKCVLNPATVIVCKAADKACTKRACDPAIGVCVTVPDDGAACSDGKPCTIGDACSNGACAPGPDKCACHSDADCMPQGGSNKCVGVKSCDKSKGAPYACAVVPGTAVTCTTAPEDKECVVTACEPKLGACVTSPLAGTVGKACNDGHPCTFGTVCGKGVCAGGKFKDCEDGTLCTEDTCASNGSCVSLPLAVTCDDANACTVGEHCVAGTCGKGLPVDCNDHNPCTADSCTSGPKGGCVSIPSATTACNDGDACTLDDRCKADGKGGVSCQPGAKKDCEDGDLCTVDEPCKAGVCGKGKPRNCDDGNLCTTDGCQPLTTKIGGGCFHAANALPCTPTAPCLGAGKCSAKTCKSGKPRLFSQTMAAPKQREGRAIVELSAGVLLVAGVERAKDDGPGDSFVARYSAVGVQLTDNILASKGHDGIHALARSGESAIAGGVVAGKSGGSDAWLARISAHGALVWSHAFGAGGDDGVNAVAVDGGQIFAAGWRPGGGGKSDGSLWITDTKGALAWQWSGGNGGDDRFVGATGGGKAATAAGYLTDTNTGFKAAWLAQVAKSGLAWQRRIGGGKGHTAATAIARLEADNLSGGWALAGYDIDPAGKVTPWLRGVTNRGGVAWKRAAAKPGQGYIAALAAGDRGFITVGATSLQGANASSDGWVARIGPTGARIGGVFAHSGPGWQVLNAVTRLKDGGFAAVGSSQVAAGGPFVDRTWLLRMDAWGHGSCTASGPCVKFTEKGCGGGGCWLATCTKAKGCAKTNLPVPCNDGDACTVLDRCGIGACKKGDKRMWSKTFGGAKYDVAHAVAVLPAGAVVIAGETQSTGKPADGMLVRVTEGGDKRWQTHWGPTGGARLRDVAIAEDGSIVAAGDKTSSGVQDAWLLRVDVDGTLLGSTAWSGPGASAVFEAVTVLHNGALATAGSFRPAGVPAADRTGTYRLFDRHGKPAGTSVDVKNGSFVRLRDIAQVAPTALVVVGATLDKGGKTDGLWARVPANGGNPVIQSLGGPGHDSLRAVAPLGAGFSGKGTTIAAGFQPGLGAAKRQSWLVAIDGSGKTLWSRNHPEAGDLILTGLTPAPGGWMASGTRPFDGVSDEAMVLHTDIVGRLRWHHGLGQGTDAASIARLGADFVLAGLGPTSIAKDSGNAWVARTDRWGNPTCNKTCIAPPKTPDICDDKNACTMDVCVAKTGKCKITPAFQGMPCGGGHVCQAGLCK